MKWFIFMFLVFSQTSNSKLHIEVFFLSTCLSHLPKVCSSFEVCFCVLCVCFSVFLQFWRSCKFFPKNLVMFHFTPPSISCKSIIKFHFHFPIPQHFTSHSSNAIICISSDSSSTCTCNFIFHLYFHSSHFLHPIK